MRITESPVDMYRSAYGTYIVTLKGNRVYESTNKFKATGVKELLDTIKPEGWESFLAHI